jgi:SAM-dependent methyltransferase
MTAVDQQTRIESLIAALQEADRKTNDEWLASLSSRKVAELEFHDRDRAPAVAVPAAGGTADTANKKYYSTVGLSRSHTDYWIRHHAKERVFLDYACGNGDHAIAAALAGADLAIGVDISGVSIENCRRRAVEAGVAEKTFFLQGDCENTGLPSNSVDLVIGDGILHHLDLSHVFPELRRVMRPGGRYYGREALNYNPVIKLYRWLTPSMRTEWEKRHILSLRDLRFAKHFFEVRNIRYWHLCSILVTALRNTPAFNGALTVANGLDSVLLRVPPISLMAWMFSFELVKRKE